MTNTVDSSFIAVLTGDIVKSRQLEQAHYDDLLYSLNNVLSYIKEQHGENAVQLMRGDSFQVIVNDVENALCYALLIRLALKERNENFDCRISIGVGNHEAIRHRVGNSTGDAFTLSGQQLDAMKQQRLVVTSVDSYFNDKLSVLIGYLDHQVTEMTKRQCAIAYLKLKSSGLTQQDIADVFDVNRVSISRSMKAARFDLIHSTIDLFEHWVKELTL